MATWTPHTLVAFGGSITYATGSETWSCGVRCVDIVTPAPFPDPAGFMADIQAALKTWFGAAGNKMSLLAHLDWLKVNNIDAAGHYADVANTNVFDYAPGQAGPVTPTHQSDSSVVFTWETGRARGRAHRGRIYPPNVYTLTNGEITSSDRSSHAAAGKALIDLLQAGDTGGGTCQPGVFSSIDGTWFPITAVSIDSLPDIQQRREKNVPGTRTLLAI